MLSDKALVYAMQSLLSNQVAFYFAAHAAHWNVEGPCFPEMHAFFGSLYEELHNAIDDIAEQIRQLGAYAPPALVDLNYTIEDGDTTGDPDKLVAGLIKANEIIQKDLDKAYEAANTAKKFGLANFIQDRMMAHSKHAWQLKAQHK